MKINFSTIVTAVLLVSLLGCGKSEATKAAEQQAVERHDARQKFKEAIAAMKVRTQGATYSEFRQAELDLKTNFEVNKKYLDDVSNKFAGMVEFMAATDVVWAYSVQYPDYPIAKEILGSVRILDPEIDKKSKLTFGEALKDPEFLPKTQVQIGLAKINNYADGMVKVLEEKK